MALKSVWLLSIVVSCLCVAADGFVVKPWLLDIFKPHIEEKDWATFVNQFLQYPDKREHLSPIDIDTSKVKRVNLPPLAFSRNTWDSRNIFLVNNTGHYAKFELIGPNKILRMSGGPFKRTTYQFENLHAHWHPSNNSDGTEHSINGRKYAMEFHAVYFNTRYGSFNNAAGKKDGIAVCGYILEVVDGEENSGLQKMADYVDMIPKPGETALVKYNVLLPFRHIALSEKYFHYSGTLTSPNPDPVKWILFPTIIKIGPKQMESYRKMKDEKGEPIDNVRDLTQKRKMPVYYIDNSLSNSLRKPTA